jgi:ubiquinone/menaquinone biosynthesis C-methylase UbiE
MSWEKKREIRLHYDAEAEGYDELYSEEQRNKYELALRNSPSVNAYENILDDGCGTGIFLEKMAGTVKSAIGVDLSSKTLRKAQAKLCNFSNVHLVCADFDYLPFPAALFNRIFMFTVLPPRRYWSSIIAETKRVLAEHGIVALSVPRRDSSRENLVTELKANMLELVELIDQHNTPDYVVICKKPRAIAT